MGIDFLQVSMLFDVPLFELMHRNYRRGEHNDDFHS